VQLFGRFPRTTRQPLDVFLCPLTVNNIFHDAKNASCKTKYLTLFHGVFNQLMLRIFKKLKIVPVDIDVGFDVIRAPKRKSNLKILNFNSRLILVKEFDLRKKGDGNSSGLIPMKEVVSTRGHSNVVPYKFWGRFGVHPECRILCVAAHTH
jgi:hypothetical protein